MKVSCIPYDLHAWRRLPAPEQYTLYSSRNGSGDVKYIKQSDGTELTQAENPFVTPEVSVFNHISEDILISATRSFELDYPATVKVTLRFLTAQDITFDNYGYAPHFQTLLARIRLYTFVFTGELLECSNAIWAGTSSVESIAWGSAFHGAAVKPDTGAFPISAPDFDVSIQMP